MRKKYWRHQLLAAILLILAIAGCSGDKVTAPTGSTVSINPVSVTVTDANPSAYHPQYFTITIKDEKGNPVQNAEVSISFPVAVPDSLGYAQLYDGSTPKNSPLTATTNADGVYYLRMDLLSGGGVSYTTNLEIRSGSAFASATITVS